MEMEHIQTTEWVEREERAIASKLFGIRTKLHIDLDILAERVGISSNELRDYEYGLVPVPASTLLLLAASMGVSMDYFFSDEITFCGSNVEVMQAKKAPVLLS